MQVVSRNLIHWARVGIGVWNDQPYDSTAIFSGSCVNSVHGQMTLIYPGVCKKGSSPACIYGTTVNLAVPTDSSDPLSRNFTKLSNNPICQVNGSVGRGGGGPAGGGGDSSAAWQTTTGEWRLLTRDKFLSNVWESPDFRTWTHIGPQPGFTQGACPSFFPLPKATRGAGPAPAGSEKPSHVYLYGDTTLLPASASHRTVLVVGTYTERGKGKVASFKATKGVARGLTPQISDNGTYYAAKDFWDSRNGRRILWGWAQIPNGAQALPRQITWHPELQQLVFSPLVEQMSLRYSPLYPSPHHVNVGADVQSVPVGPWSAGAAQQAEVLATFAMPANEAATFGVGILGVLEAFVEFVPAPTGHSVGGLRSGATSPSRQVRVGVRARNTTVPGGALVKRYMVETDLMGGDYNKNSHRHFPPGTNPELCQAECDAAEECVAWTYVIRGEPKGSGDCCLKKMGATGHEKSLNLCPHHAPACTSGLKVPRHVTHCDNSGERGATAAEAQLSLLPTDKELEIRVFTDHTILEVFFVDGRVALTTPLPPMGQDDDAGFELFTSAKQEIAVTVAAWQVGEIWVSPDSILEQVEASSFLDRP